MNTAGRLLSIYDQLLSRSRGKDARMTSVWAEIFELETSNPHLEDEVVMCLQALRSEVGLLSTRLLSLGAPNDLMEPGISRFRTVTSTTQLNVGLRNLVDHINPPENRLAFAWANWALRAESEADMPADELVELRSELDSLEASLQDTEMTPYLRDFIQRQISAIRNALRVYKVQGVKPIEEALHQVAGAYTVEKNEVEAQQMKASGDAQNLFARTGELIKRTAEVADNLDKIRKAGEGAYTLAASVAPLVLVYGQSLLK